MYVLLSSAGPTHCAARGCVFKPSMSKLYVGECPIYKVQVLFFFLKRLFLHGKCFLYCEKVVVPHRLPKMLLKRYQYSVMLKKYFIQLSDVFAFF